MLDLFSGIGGFALAAQWCWGDELDIVGFCEIEKYAQKVLQKNFPGVPIYEDITKLNGKDFKNIDIITGGFPCQDISIAGKGEGIEGSRSGLWTEMHRIIREIRPRYALIENVPMLTIRGGTRVIADLAEIGYDAEWQIIGADDVGAWHRRKRIWIVAYPRHLCRGNHESGDVGLCGREQIEKTQWSASQFEAAGSSEESEALAYSECFGSIQRKHEGRSRCEEGLFEGNGKDVVNSNGKREIGNKSEYREGCGFESRSEDVAHSKSKRVEGCGTGGEQESHTYAQEGLSMCEGERSRATEGSIGTSIRGMVDGIPEGLHKDVMWQKEPEDINKISVGVKDRIQRLKGLGNSICPQVAYEIMKLLK